MACRQATYHEPSRYSVSSALMVRAWRQYMEKYAIRQPAVGVAAVAASVVRVCAAVQLRARQQHAFTCHAWGARCPALPPLRLAPRHVTMAPRALRP